MKKIVALSLLCIFLSKNADAARPMITDDARLTKGGVRHIISGKGNY